jgi:dihydropyrimidinase
MIQFDLVIRGGTVVTATGSVNADVGIVSGRIPSVAAKIEGCQKEIDASGMLVISGGIDNHVHLAQPTFGGPEIETRSAIAGGNTTVSPFALQPRGASLRASVIDYHKEAGGKCYADYEFYLIIYYPSTTVLGQELPALVADGYTSFKIFMTYDDLVLNDRQLLEVCECARTCGALVMIHCEGYDAIDLSLIGSNAPGNLRLWSSGKQRIGPSAMPNRRTSPSC